MMPGRWAAVLGVGVCAAIAAVGPIPSAGAGQRIAQLNISIDDGRESTTVGDQLQYTITVTNTGAEPLVGLVITQSMPAGLIFGSADGTGIPTAAADAVTWTTDLAADQKATFTSTMNVGGTDEQTLRLASVACAALTTDGLPIVCAADSDLLPAGAAAVVAQPEIPVATAEPINSRWYVGAVSGIVVAGSAVLLFRQRRRNRNADRQTAG